MTVLAAAGEEPRALTCGGIRIGVTKVGELKTPGGAPLALYTYIAPWLADGPLQLEVVRANGVATDRITLDPVEPDQPRDYVRNCG
ncbi:hypothetical protein [Streptacidiphilus rugosus]|uniref:hypothetical protein n=1 Tax=Streptacidiphilus rugosus TaxID=405783 RepID=UPI00055CC345|nr:hypothetical protein [Streptacidiphilus rugosus]